MAKRVRFNKQTLELWDGKPFDRDPCIGTIVQTLGPLQDVYRVEWDDGLVFNVSAYEVVEVSNG